MYHPSTIYVYMLNGITHPTESRSQTDRFTIKMLETVCSFFIFLTAKITIIFPERQKKNDKIV